HVLVVLGGGGKGGPNPAQGKTGWAWFGGPAIARFPRAPRICRPRNNWPPPLFVRQSAFPPIHNLCGSLGSITNGTMKRKLLAGSSIPNRALPKVFPPSVDFRSDNRVVST